MIDRSPTVGGKNSNQMDLGESNTTDEMPPPSNSSASQEHRSGANGSRRTTNNSSKHTSTTKTATSTNNRNRSSSSGGNKRHRDEQDAAVGEDREELLEELISENVKQANQIEHLEQRVKELERANRKLEADYSAQFKALAERVTKIEAGASAFPSLDGSSGTLWSSVASRATAGSSAPKPSDLQREVTNSVLSENEERERRKQNVLIFGLAESQATTENIREEDDKKAIAEMLQVMKVRPENIKSVKRFKRKAGDSNRAPPVFVRLNDKVDRNEILSAARFLKDSEKFKKVFVNPDLTEFERAQSKQLREARKAKNDDAVASNAPFRFVIRGSELRKVNREGNNLQPQRPPRVQQTQAADTKQQQQHQLRQPNQ